MKTSSLLPIVLMFGFLTTSYSQENRNHDNRPDNNPREIRREIRPNLKEELLLKIEKLEKDFSFRVNRRDRAELQKQIDEIIRLIDRLPSEERVIRHEPMPMAEPEFRELFNAVRRASFDDNKIQLVNTSVNYNYFTVAQTIELANTTAFDDSRLEIIKILYPKVLDINRNYLLYDCFRFDATKKKLTEYISSFEQREHRNK